MADGSRKLAGRHSKLRLSTGLTPRRRHQVCDPRVVSRAAVDEPLLLHRVSRFFLLQPEAELAATVEDRATTKVSMKEEDSSESGELCGGGS
jgi:hypothetical protein